MGGFITFAANFHSTASEPSMATYLIFISIMVVGSILALLIQPTESVIRADGSRVQLDVRKQNNSLSLLMLYCVTTDDFTVSSA
mgnify:CR=1 FL=1